LALVVLSGTGEGRNAARRLGRRRLGVRLLPARGRQRGVVRRLGRLAEFGFELGDAGEESFVLRKGRPGDEHQFCLAHLIRDAQYAIDHGDTVFAPGLKALLKDACAVGRRRPDLADATIAAHRRRLEMQLERLLALKPTDTEGRKLRDAVALDCRGKLLVFLKRRDVEPTNNESERALRPSVIFRNYAQPTVMLSPRRDAGRWRRPTA
jgi:hypothetical protein